MDLVRQNVEYESLMKDFSCDDGGPEYDWSPATFQYPKGFGVSWLKEVDSDCTSESCSELELPDVNLATMNSDQKFAFNLAVDKLMNYKYDRSSSIRPLSLIVEDTAESGKSYLITGYALSMTLA